MSLAQRLADNRGQHSSDFGIYYLNMDCGSRVDLSANHFAAVGSRSFEAHTTAGAQELERSRSQSRVVLRNANDRKNGPVSHRRSRFGLSPTGS